MIYLLAWIGVPKDRKKGWLASSNYALDHDGKITAKTILSWKDEIQDFADLEYSPTILNIIKLEDEE